jgi:hypothetical protein
MERKELVAKAVAAGIKGANTIKSVVLEQMLSEMIKPETTGKRGHPINPDSVRQVRIAELEEKRASGELKKGRPIKADSARQMRLVELETKRLNGELRKGRPVNGESARQKRIAEMEAKKAANGGVMPLGRPKVVIDETAS